MSYNVLLNKTVQMFLSLWVKQKQQIHVWNGKRRRRTSSLSRERHIRTCGSWKQPWSTASARLCMVCTVNRKRAFISSVWGQRSRQFHAWQTLREELWPRSVPLTPGEIHRFTTKVHKMIQVMSVRDQEWHGRVLSWWSRHTDELWSCLWRAVLILQRKYMK